MTATRTADAPAADTATAKAPAGPWLREDLIHPDPLLDSLVELCRIHGRPMSRDETPNRLSRRVLVR